jgi:hypothetical protein
MRDNLVRTVTDGLKWLVHLLDGRSVARLYDLHVVSEDSVKEFLNCLRRLDLENLNKGGVNFPAIDLGDKARRLSFQVTTENSAKKIQGSFNTFHKHGLGTDYDEVFFLILGRKQKKYSTIRPGPISFNPTRHIIDVADLIREATGVDNERLAHLAKIIQGAGLSVSAPQDSDEQAFRKIHFHFDRDALKHRWTQEGRITGFEAALNELTELLGKGSIQGKQITKPVYLFSDQKLSMELSGLKNALGNLKAAFNERVNSHEIRPGDEFAFFKDRQAAETMNAAKLRVLQEINKIGQRYSLPPISMNAPQFPV